MNTIHPSAVIGKNVTLGEGNEIGPGCVIDDVAALGSRNKLWMNVYVGPGTTIGNDNQFFRALQRGSNLMILHLKFSFMTEALCCYPVIDGINIF
ncbi:MAG: hypothetical protein AAB263_21615 [Planctomycetota bacterium]